MRFYQLLPILGMAVVAMYLILSSLFCIFFESKEDKTLWIGRQIVGEDYTIQEGFRDDGIVVWKKEEVVK